jgi:hypothetical protein
LQFVGGVILVGGGVDLAQISGNLLAVLVGDVLQRRANLVRETGLDCRLGEGRFDRVRYCTEIRDTFWDVSRPV